MEAYQAVVEESHSPEFWDSLENFTSLSVDRTKLGLCLTLCGQSVALKVADNEPYQGLVLLAG